MTLVLPNVGEGLALKNFFNYEAPQNQNLRLFSSNTTPAEADVLGTYTEASGNGYAAQGLTGSSWSLTTGDPSYMSYAQQTFTFTGAAGNMYGYHVNQASSTTLMYAERFSDGPYNIVNNGDAVKVTPRFEQS
jgi:hypothetical protein